MRLPLDLLSSKTQKRPHLDTAPGVRESEQGVAQAACSHSGFLGVWVDIEELPFHERPN